LDSKGSQTHQVAVELLKSELANVPEQMESESVKNSRQKRLDSQVGQLIWNVVNPLSFLSRNISSVLNQSQESMDPPRQVASDHWRQRPSEETTDNFREENYKVLNESFGKNQLEQSKAAVNHVRNFDDFRKTLNNLKIVFNTEVCKETEGQSSNNKAFVPDLVKQYSELDAQMISTYEQELNYVYSDSDNNCLIHFSGHSQENNQFSRRHSTPSFTSNSQISPLKKLQSLIRQSKLPEYQGLLKDDWTSDQKINILINDIEQEIIKRESEFIAIEKQLRVKI